MGRGGIFPAVSNFEQMQNTTSLYLTRETFYEEMLRAVARVLLRRGSTNVAPRLPWRSRMMTRVPFDDPEPDMGKSRDEADSTEFLTSRPNKATFQWPPECLWPFIEDERNGES